MICFKKKIRPIILLLLWLAGACCAGDGDFAYRLKCELKNGEISKGTACAISAHTLVTAAHLLKDADEIFIDHPIGWLRCTVVKIDAAHEIDLAVIECKSAEFKFVPLDTSERTAGEKITIWASVAGKNIRALNGALQSLFDSHRWVCAVGGYDHGGSGSPVIMNKKLVGVATGMAPDANGNAVPNTAVFVASDCIQHVLAPDTFAGDVLPPPKTKAELIPEPTQRVSIVLTPQNSATSNELHAKPLETFQAPKSDTCVSRRCHATVKQSLKVDSNQKPAVAFRLRWDSEGDGHGQGGWVSE